MTRPLRLFSNSKIYHIILKGIDNQNIFYDDQDREFFLKQISATKKEFYYKIYAYCLMDNHVHMIIRSEDSFLSKSIQSLTIRYVYYFNKKYKRIGTLFQDRYRSKNIENQRYFLDVCRYVHRNPENAGICKTEDYKWSSYKEYINKEKIIDKNILLHYFNNDINEFIKYTSKIDEIQNLNEFTEYEMIEKLTDEQLTYIIMKKFKIEDVKDIPIFFKNRNKEELDRNIEELKHIKGTNKTQLARVTRMGRKHIGNVWEQKRTDTK